jgi:hypothetical protein
VVGPGLADGHGGSGGSGGQVTVVRARHVLTMGPEGDLVRASRPLAEELVTRAGLGAYSALARQGG